METMGDRVKRLREDKDWSQQQLADAAGVSQPSVSDIENNRTRDPKRHVVKGLAKALATSVRYLETGIDEPDPEDPYGPRLDEILSLLRSLRLSSDARRLGEVLDAMPEHLKAQAYILARQAMTELLYPPDDPPGDGPSAPDTPEPSPKPAGETRTAPDNGR